MEGNKSESEAEDAGPPKPKYKRTVLTLK